MNNYTVTPRYLKRKTTSCRKGNFSTAVSDPMGKGESDNYSGRILGRKVRAREGFAGVSYLDVLTVGGEVLLG